MSESSTLPPAAGASTSTLEVLTVEQAATLLQLHPQTLYEAIKKGQVTGVVRFGRAVRIRRDLLLESFRATPAGGSARPAQGK